MTYAIQGGRPDPTLEYDVTDAATGAPMRITVLSGVMAIVFQHDGWKVWTGDDINRRQPMGFIVPGMLPLPPGPEPLLVAEMFLTKATFHMPGVHVPSSRTTGVQDVHAQLVPDPQRPGHRAVNLSFTCVGKEENIVVRYRVTVYRGK